MVPVYLLGRLHLPIKAATVGQAGVFMLCAVHDESPCHFEEGETNTIVYHKYGSSDILQLQEIETPTIKDDEAVAKVHAVSVNPLDWNSSRNPCGLRFWRDLNRSLWFVVSSTPNHEREANGGHQCYSKRRLYSG